ncbi:hypothetical protein [Baekduia soli]|nr:hypothetical protein [Baekduia soli]
MVAATHGEPVAEARDVGGLAVVVRAGHRAHRAPAPRSVTG